MSNSSLFTPALLRIHSFVLFAVHETRRTTETYAVNTCVQIARPAFTGHEEGSVDSALVARPVITDAILHSRDHDPWTGSVRGVAWWCGNAVERHSGKSPRTRSISLFSGPNCPPPNAGFGIKNLKKIPGVTPPDPVSGRGRPPPASTLSTATRRARGRKLPRCWDLGLGNRSPKSKFTTTPLGRVVCAKHCRVVFFANTVR